MSSHTKPKRRRPLLPFELRPEWITAVIDTREQQPFDLSPLRTVRGTLVTGDYSVRGLENVVAVERKSLADLVACVGSQRTRFEKEVQRLLAYPVRALVVEATWAGLEAGRWRGQVCPEAVVGSVLGWIGRGLPVVMAGTRDRAEKYVVRLLILSARRRWREAYEFVKNTG